MRQGRVPVVLVIADNSLNPQVVADLLAEAGCESVLVPTGQQAFAFLTLRRPDLILLDMMTPEMDGHEVCERLGREKATRDIPVMCLLAKSGPDPAMKNLAAGVVDYIPVPIHAAEFKMRVRTQLTLKRALEDLAHMAEQLQQVNAELQRVDDLVQAKNVQFKQAMAEVELLSQTDPLTGLYNRRHMMMHLSNEHARSQRSGREFAIAIANVDLFKAVNDTFGHACGDSVVQTLAALVKSGVREQDSVARWGGEEFLILLPDASLLNANILAERLRRLVEAHEIQHGGAVLRMTMTFGVVACGPKRTVDEAIHLADRALNTGKAQGRNCVVMAIAECASES